MNKKAFVYVNLGTPRSTDRKDVARYLREFLIDPYVIDIPFVFRWFLVNVIIAPFRSKQTSEAYKQIWQANGSPLMINSQNLVRKLQTRLKDRYEKVVLGMRYGEPSLKTQIQNLISEGVTDIDVVTAYPQYAQSSTETAFAVIRSACNAHPAVRVRVVKSYEGLEGFIQAFAQNIEKSASDFKPDHYLFSYHGLPKKHLAKISNECQGEGDCSLRSTPQNQMCYRRQCYVTTGALVRKLKLMPNQFSHGFQSRFTEGWVRPFTDDLIKSLAEKGVKKLLVACPSFTADCLETLEEIGMREREQFIAHGGVDLKLVPCLNDDDLWVEAVYNLIAEQKYWVNL